MKWLSVILAATVSVAVYAQSPELNTFRNEGNPLVRTKYTADPAPLVASDGRLYVFCGHDECFEDRPGYEGKYGFNITEWLCYSTEDMVNWVDHGVVLKPTDFEWAVGEAWASQVVEKDGKFYFYVSTQSGDPDCKAVGVAVADSPVGPYKDAIGKALVLDDMTPNGPRGWWNDIDPSVMIDDDGTPWMSWGNGTCFLVRLDRNMVELDGEIQTLPMENYVEGPWIYKRNGHYYNVYASMGQGRETISYAMADSIEGPWTFKGEVTGMAEDSFTIHPGVVDYKGRSYLFYHNSTLSLDGYGPATGRRSICVDELYYKDDGSIVPVVQTKRGTTVLEDFVPASTNQPGSQYPMVNSEGVVRARLSAPYAGSVKLDIGGVKYPMVKDENGVWTGDSEPQDEGFHYYQLEVDGASVPDPGSQYFYGAMRWGSGVDVPAHDQDFYALRNVPHGNIQQVLFYSESTDCVRRAFVYTPPGYGSSKKRYPVLYLQHGWGENEYSWPNQGKTNLIMDNLIAEGKAVPFIVVMTYGMTNEVRFGGIRGFNFKDFETVLVDELIPYIDANFRTIAKKDSRAMAGLSMGGMETRNITISRPEVFGYYGIFSGGMYTPQELEGHDVELVFLSCGSKENPDGITKAVDDLKAAGFNAVSYVSEGTAHEFQSWRRSLYQMAVLLFK